MEVQSLCFYRFDDEDGTFEFQDKLLYDISRDYLDVLGGGFDNDFFLSKNHETYYFAREKGGRNELRYQRFQLHRHTMRSKFIPKYQDYQEHTGTEKLEMLLDFRINIPFDFADIDDLQISFIKEAKEFSTLREDQLSSEKSFLEAQYVMLKKKQRKVGGSGYSKLLVYHLKDLVCCNDHDSKPLLRFDNEEFLAIQCAFVIKSKKANQKNQATFIFKGFNIDYKVEYEEHPSGEPSTILTETKSRSIDSFRRAHYHTIEPRFLRIELERSNESFDQFFFFNNVNGDIQLIYPFHSFREQFISTGIHNKKHEIDHHIHQLFFGKQKKGPIVYIDENQGHVMTEKLRRHILNDAMQTEADLESASEVKGDHYFTSKDLIVMINSEKSQIEVWSVDPDYVNSEMTRELEELEVDNDKSLLLKILSQFSLDHHP